MNHDNLRAFLSILCYGIGIAAAMYVGGWLMIVQPVKGLIAAHVMGTLTFRQILVTVMKIVSSATVYGLIWCLGYIASNHFRDKE